MYYVVFTTFTDLSRVERGIELNLEDDDSDEDDEEYDVHMILDEIDHVQHENKSKGGGENKEQFEDEAQGEFKVN
jgi:hypothetical protein